MIADHRVALAKEALSPAFEEAVAYTGFALDRFKARTERDGAALAILATYRAGQPGDPVFDRLHDLAAARGLYRRLCTRGPDRRPSGCIGC